MSDVITSATFKFRADISDFSRAMREVTRFVQLVNAEFKKANTGVGEWSKSLEGTRAQLDKQKMLLSAYKRQLEILELEYQRLKDAGQDNTASMQRLATQITDTKSKILAAETEVEKYTHTLNAMEGELNDSVESTNEFATETDKLRATISTQERALEVLKDRYASLQVEERDTTQESKQLEREITDLNQELTQNKNRLNDAENAADRLTGSIQRTSDGFTVFKGVLANLVTDAIRRGIMELRELAQYVWDAGTQFELSMARVEAIANATSSEMGEITDKALEMGATTRYTATEAGDAMYYMAQAGWDANEILGGIAGTLDLAAASGNDLKEVADFVTDGLTALGYEAKDATHFADVLAATAANSNTDIEKIGETFSYAAGAAGALGYSMEDVALATGLMASAGVKGSRAGTALRNIFGRLTGDIDLVHTGLDGVEETFTVFTTDAEGKVRPFRDILTDLREAFDHLDPQEQIAAAKELATQWGSTGFLAMINATTESVDDLTRAIDESAGAARRMANTMLDNVGGDLTILKSDIETKAIATFETAAPRIRTSIAQIKRALDDLDWEQIGQDAKKLAGAIGDGITFIIRNGDTIIATIKGIGGALATLWVADKIGLLVSAIGQIRTAAELAAGAKGVGKLTAVLTELGGKNLAAGIEALVGPLGLIAGVLGGEIIALQEYKKWCRESAEATYGLSEATEELLGEASMASSQWDLISEAAEKEGAAINAEIDYVRDLKDEYNSLLDSNGQIQEGYEARASFILNQMAEALGMEVADIEAVIDANGRLGDSIDELITKRKGEMLLDAYEEEYRNARATNIDTTKTLIDLIDEQSKRQEEVNRLTEEYNKLGGDEGAGIGKYSALRWRKAKEDLDVAKEALQEINDQVEHTSTQYTEAQGVIENYGALTEAVFNNNSDLIEQYSALLSGGLRSATSATEDELRQQYEEWDSYYQRALLLVQSGNTNITDATLSEIKNMRDQAAAEYSQAGKGGADTYIDATIDEHTARENDLYAAGSQSTDAVYQGGLKDAESDGTDVGTTYAEGQIGAINNNADQSYAAGQNLEKEAYDGANQDAHSDAEESGKNFLRGFLRGLLNISLQGQIINAAYNIAKWAHNALKKGQDESSPSKLTEQSGKYFGLGYRNGIVETMGDVQKAAGGLAKRAIFALKDAQEEHSPSHLTYWSGRMFTQGYADGMAVDVNNVQKSAQYLANAAMSSLLAANSYDFSATADSIVDQFNAALEDRIDSSENWTNHWVENAIYPIDQEIERLESLRDASDSSMKDYYNSLIEQQKNYRSEVQNDLKYAIGEFKTALKEYESAAKELFENVIGGISDKYQDLYDNLIDKQNDLTEKMRSAGDLFEVSGAGVMTINDLNDQTRAITEYANKLKLIKSKVSAELFDTITQYDMKEGSAFITQLLSMSQRELEAYDDAYLRKLELTKKYSEDIYSSDAKSLMRSFRDEISNAFREVTDGMKSLGVSAADGFIKGMTSEINNGGLMNVGRAIVDMFRETLQIHSPSKIMEKLGIYTMQGYANGIKEMYKYVQNTISSITDGISLNVGGLDIGKAKSKINKSANTVTNNNITNNYNLVQNNTSPKSLSALETYQARRQQMAMFKTVVQGV